jgi:hypothetical protein
MCLCVPEKDLLVSPSVKNKFYVYLNILLQLNACLAKVGLVLTLYPIQQNIYLQA